MIDTMVVGIDEVGRGPWAGPLVFGAVVLGSADIDGLTDSKKLSKKKRQALDGEIRSKATAFGLGWVSAEELDNIGMSKACELACRRALEQITVPYSEIIIDGTVNFLKDTGKGPYVTTMKQADLLVPSVSAASILAKVARDTFMEDQDELYPGYGFGSHVGYGTEAHRKALKEFGVTPLHRKSFAPIAVLLEANTSSPTSPIPISTTKKLPQNQVAQNSKRGIGGSNGTSEVSEADRDDWVSAGSTRVLPKTTRRIGDVSEQAAAVHIAAQGFEILERNWKTKACEIDIVATRDGILYFVEVKHRKTDYQGGGIAAITPKKLQQMLRAAQLYAHWHKADDADMRLMVVTTTGTPPVVNSELLLD